MDPVVAEGGGGKCHEGSRCLRKTSESITGGSSLPHSKGLTGNTRTVSVFLEGIKQSFADLALFDLKYGFYVENYPSRGSPLHGIDDLVSIARGFV